MSTTSIFFYFLSRLTASTLFEIGSRNDDERGIAKALIRKDKLVVIHRRPTVGKLTWRLRMSSSIIRPRHFPFLSKDEVERLETLEFALNTNLKKRMDNFVYVMNQWYRHLIFGEGDKCYEWCWLLIIFYNLDKKHGRLQFPLDINYVVYYRQHPKKVIQHSWMVLPFHAHCAQMQRGNQAHRSRIRLFRSESPKS